MGARWKGLIKLCGAKCDAKRSTVIWFALSASASAMANPPSVEIKALGQVLWMWAGRQGSAYTGPREVGFQAGAVRIRPSSSLAKKAENKDVAGPINGLAPREIADGTIDITLLSKASIFPHGCSYEKP